MWENVTPQKPPSSAAAPASSARASRGRSPKEHEPPLRLKEAYSPCSCWIVQPRPLV